MKIAINTLPLKLGHQGRGIGFYTKNLLVGLREKSDIEIQEFADISEVSSADIVHYPFFDLFYRSLPIKKKFPTVITIHDVIPLIFPKYYPPGVRGSINNLFQRLALKDVKAIITDSKSSKDDINKILKITPSKIFPVYLASAPHFKKISDSKILDKINAKYHLPEIFALYIGSVNWNKNLLNLTQACLDADINLVLVGRDFEDKLNLNHPERKSYGQFLEKFSTNAMVQILGFVSDEDLVALMNLAKVALLPSFYEGFGLPIVEAQACSTPILTGNVSSMPEVAGEGAILVNPDSISEISQGIRNILEDKIFRENLIKKGTENSKRFSWDKTVNETVKVYEYAIAHK